MIWTENWQEAARLT